MSAKIVSSLEMNGVEKILCAHGGWLTIAHIAHLTGDHAILARNAPYAIQHLLKRHSRMRSRIRVENNRYLLETIEYDDEQLRVDLFFSTVKTTNESWGKFVENRCNQNPYSNMGTVVFPLFHFMLFFDSQHSQLSDGNFFHLILYTNHCASDGRSGYVLINDFLTLVTCPNLLEIPEPINTEILPFLGQLMPRPYGPFYPLISFIVKHIIKQELRHSEEPRIPVKSVPHVDCEPTKYHVQRYKMKFLFSSSFSNLYLKLHDQCRLHEVTLHDPLVSCLLLAIHHCFPLEDTDYLDPFNIEMNIDMRSRLPLSPLTSSSVGFFVAADDFYLDQSLSVHSTEFWSLAHQCMTITRKLLKRNGVFLSTSVFCDMMRHERIFNQLTRLFPEGRTVEFDFSNIGKYPFSCNYNQGQIRLRGMHVINNGSVYRSSSTVYITCVGDEQLDFSLSHEMESDEKAKEFLNYYIHLLEVCADAKRCKSETTLDELLTMVELEHRF